MNSLRLTDIATPLAIAMWDFTWLMRHQPRDAFADWDVVLDELAERGYNALRIDCFPHLVAADREGRVQEQFFHAQANLIHTLWGNQYSITTRPRKALVEFVGKCRDRSIHVGLSTWFGAHGTDRHTNVEGVDGFLRVWDETLVLLDEHGLLSQVIYVDLLNEYPLWHGFSWLHDQLQLLADPGDVAESYLANVHEQNVLEGLVTERKFNARQVSFYNKFLNDVITTLKRKWPRLEFFASVSKAFDTPWQDLDFSQSAALDMHVWFVHQREFSLYTDYFKDIHPRPNEQRFAICYEKILRHWAQEKPSLIQWMENEIAGAADFARSNGLAVGNTEGWGPIVWMDHPHLDWDWVKETGEICVSLAVKHGYHFICTSNFTHPQFAGIWDDIAWHQRVTRAIRKSQ